LKTFRKRTGKKKDMLKDQDEFLSLSQKALKYAQGHTKQVYVALGAIAVVAVLTVLVSMLFETSRKNVLAKESEALKYYDVNSPVPGDKPMSSADRLKKAKELFAEVADKHSGSPVAVQALYYKANTDMEMGNLDAAIDGYKKLMDKAASDKVMMSLVGKRLAEAYLAKGNMQGAVDSYKKVAATEGGYLRDDAHYQLAKIYEGMGKKEDALAEYRAIIKDFPNSLLLDDAKREESRITGVPLPSPAPPVMGGTPFAPVVVQPAGGAQVPVTAVPVPAGKATAPATAAAPVSAPAPAAKAPAPAPHKK